jgi:hypothetical protein
MSSPLTVDLFVEDRAHEEFLKAMLRRIATEQERSVIVRVRSARGATRECWKSCLCIRKVF